jgi:hypothetical protein
MSADRPLTLADIPMLAAELARIISANDARQKDTAHLVRTTTPQQRNAQAREQRKKEVAAMKLQRGKK